MNTVLKYPIIYFLQQERDNPPVYKQDNGNSTGKMELLSRNGKLNKSNSSNSLKTPVNNSLEEVLRIRKKWSLLKLQKAYRYYKQCKKLIVKETDNLHKDLNARSSIATSITPNKDQEGKKVA